MDRNTFNRRAFTGAALAGATLMLAQEGSAQSSGKILNKKQLSALVSSAKTAADHLKLAAHYHAVAAKHEMEAKDHTELAAKYKANPTVNDQKRPNAPDTASHCLTYAAHCRDLAKDMHKMAEMHEEMAKNVK